MGLEVEDFEALQRIVRTGSGFYRLLPATFMPDEPNEIAPLVEKPGI